VVVSRIRRDYLQLILDGIKMQVSLCSKLNLWCIDPPALTSGIIRSINKMSDHAIENFWKYIETNLVAKTPLEIFKVNGIKVLLILQHMKTHVEYSRKYGIYLDELDCYVGKSGLECIKVPSTHVLKIYIIGTYNDEVRFKLNAIYILKTLQKIEPKIFNELMDSIKGVINRDIKSLKTLLKTITITVNKHKNILTEILGPEIAHISTNDYDKLLHYSHILRKLLRT